MTQSNMPIYKGLAPGLNTEGQIPNLAALLRTVAKTASYTVTTDDSGTVFTTTGATGAVVFTLPAVATASAGCFYIFVNTVDQDMTVTSGTADKLVYDGDAAADSLAFSTASHKIGGAVLVVCDGANWLSFVAGNGSAVATAAS